MFFGWEGPEREWGWGGRLFEFEFEGVGGGVGWALIRGWALIQFFCLQDGRLFEVGANSRLGAYSNKYGNHHKLLAFGVVSHGRFDCMMM